MQNIPTTDEIEKIKRIAIEDMRDIIRSAVSSTNPWDIRDLPAELANSLPAHLEKIVIARFDELSKQIVIGAHVGEIIRLIGEKK